MKKREARIDRDRKSVLMGSADGYVMVRRPGCMPYILPEKTWLQLPLFIDGAGRAKPSEVEGS